MVSSGTFTSTEDNNNNNNGNNDDDNGDDYSYLTPLVLSVVRYP